MEFVNSLGSHTNDFQSGQLFENFSTEDAIVWVDPLDGTASFLANDLSAVTVLIGVSIKGYSRIGIVHYPFIDGKDNCQTLFGTTEHGLYKICYEHNFSYKAISEQIPQYLEPFNFN